MIIDYLCNVAPKDVGYFSFVIEGWKQENDNKLLYEEVTEAKNIELIPQEVNF